MSGATSNEWYFFAGRPDYQFNLPMPQPDGRVAFESPDLDPLPPAPYVKTLSAIAVPPGARYDALDLPGPETIMVVDRTAAIDVGDGIRQLTGGQGALAQAGKTLAIINRGSDTLQVLDFAVTALTAT